MKKIFFALSIFSWSLLGCKETSKENEQEQTVAASPEEHHHEDESEAIHLDNGVKWKVDTNMIVYIRKMEKDILEFSETENKNYQKLAGELQKNISLLTANCTMEGEAHDELHKWLLPYIDLVNELSAIKDDSTASKQFENIQTSFQTFNQYFQ